MIRRRRKITNTAMIATQRFVAVVVTIFAFASMAKVIAQQPLSDACSAQNTELADDADLQALQQKVNSAGSSSICAGCIALNESCSCKSYMLPDDLETVSSFNERCVKLDSESCGLRVTLVQDVGGNKTITKTFIDLPIACIPNACSPNDRISLQQSKMLVLEIIVF